MKKYNVCVVGATGLVGTTFLEVLAEYNFPIENLKLLASERSAGKVINFKGKDYIVEAVNENSFNGYDLALFGAGGETSKKYCPIAVKAGLTVIDNSSAFRQDPSVGLVVPEINILDTKINKLIANPNCSTIQSVLPLKALEDKYGINRVFYSTYQAVSGSGQKGKEDLKKALNGEECTFYPHDISKTCIPEIDSFLEDGYTKEEVKMVNETRKILHRPDLAVSATCIRVPVANSHGVSMMVELNKEFTVSEVKEVLAAYPGIKVVDDGPNHLYPTSTLANGNDFVYVGRIRKDYGSKNSLLLYCVADNIRKGAAANAVQIALKMAENDSL